MASSSPIGPTEAAVKRSLDKAVQGAQRCLEEQWERFEKAIHETSCEQPVSITIAVRFRPGKESKRKSRPPQIRIESKSSLPTVRRVFSARDSGGQIVLDFGSEE